MPCPGGHGAKAKARWLPACLAGVAAGNLSARQRASENPAMNLSPRGFQAFCSTSACRAAGLSVAQSHKDLLAEERFKEPLAPDSRPL